MPVHILGGRALKLNEDAIDDDAWWVDALAAAKVDGEEPIFATVYVRSFQTYSKPVALACSDGKTYVVKGLQVRGASPALNRAMFTDQVVGRLGRMMRAPVGDVALVRLPIEFVREEAALAHMLPGIAHGSRWIDGVRESRLYEHLDVMENRLRYADLAILYGWCYGFDLQFLFATNPPYLVYSADHGHFFPEGPNWTRISLVRDKFASPHAEVIGGAGVHIDDLRTSCAKLNGINNAMIARAVAAPPNSWGVPVPDRLRLAKYLSSRRVQLLKSLIPSLTTSGAP